MRKKNRSFLVMALLSASLLVSVFPIVKAQSPAAPAAKATNWSDPATWPNRKVPVAGRPLRGWAVGRNNWTFFGSDRGGRTAAVLRSWGTVGGE